MENWRAVVGYEGLYEVSDCGNVRSLNWRSKGITKSLWLKPTRYGYRQVYLSKNGKGKMFLVHRLVATAFIPNPDSLPVINHIDENKINNCVSNLEWCTHLQNSRAYYANHPSQLHEKRGHYKPKGEHRNSKYCNRNICKIIQMTERGEFVKVWDYAIDARHAHGYSTTSIWECCEGKRKTAYGFRWQFAIDNNAE